MNKEDLEKSQLGSSALFSFLNQFELDIYTRIVLEELFKEIYGSEKTLPVPSKERQEGV